MNVLQVVGYKNAGKTTLVCQLVSMLSSLGIRVGTLKRDAHDADPEPEGADTRRHREAGASVAVLSGDSLTLWVSGRAQPLERLLASLKEAGMQAVIMEGFKTASYPKLVILRDDGDRELLALPGIAAVLLRGPAPEAVRQAQASGLPVFRSDGTSFGADLLDFVKPYLTGTGTKGGRESI